VFRFLPFFCLSPGIFLCICVHCMFGGSCVDYICWWRL
jgi:hypothetical protein